MLQWEMDDFLTHGSSARSHGLVATVTDGRGDMRIVTGVPSRFKNL